ISLLDRAQTTAAVDSSGVSKEDAVAHLLRQSSIWRGSHSSQNTGHYLSTGFAELDAHLPGGGWRLDAVTEILCDQQGIGELRLVMPALAKLSQQKKWIVWVAPPHIPYAPALHGYQVELSQLLWIQAKSSSESIWAAEQSLSHPDCGATLLWASDINDRDLRRLQIASEGDQSWALVFRNSSARKGFSPAATRLVLYSEFGRTQVHVLKCRGGKAFESSLKLAL
ncbi:MAG: translesion DNA synthesis-associated protein ImuA, partial [Gammaproteobacteria bacterium]|nr:translesion DNA synthesis-associated protein ImuA [Gammaproteobacteria bacterium]